MSDQKETAFWKRKLAAYLHDPPSKCLDIWKHTERSREAMSRAGLSEQEIGKYAKDADHTAAAADRFPFPRSQAANLSCHFDGIRNGFIHPLSGSSEGAKGVFRFHQELKNLGAIEGGDSEVQPCWQTDTQPFPNEAEEWKARFFLHWRLWPQLAAEKEYRWKFLPADTRMPDHSIWTHMGVVSALAGCDEDAHKPLTDYRNRTKLKGAFLKFQLGPVQEFIAAARSTRDLWSGSYLLSWLMAAGLKEIADRVGPDSVIFPNLWGQPLIDYRFKDHLWDKIKLDRGRDQQSTAWEAYMRHRPEDLLTPNLPNVFLAVVPSDQAEAIAGHVEEKIRKEWKEIGASVWEACEELDLMDERTLKGLSSEVRKARFDGQLSKHLAISWQVTPWPESIAEVRELYKSVPEPQDETDENGKPLPTLSERFDTVVKAATDGMRLDDRDRRYYTDKTKTELNNVGLAWPLLYSLNGWALDATRQVRDFAAWSDGGWDVGVASNKDSLTGKEEAVAGGREWLTACESLNGSLPKRFKKEDWLGAANLVKRLWDLTFLQKHWDLDSFRMPNTRGLAQHKPFSADEDDADKLSGDKYFAVLAFDGDSIGQWVSGTKTPAYSDILANYDGGGALEYFERYPEKLGGFLETRRLLSPSYHLQFSEALSNFAIKCAATVVEAHDGRLIYAGGDDVLAMLPADSAIACAEDLVRAFQGKCPRKSGRRTTKGDLIPQTAITKALKDGQSELPDGFLAIEGEKTQDGFQIPFIVPGPEATASVGIAIAHFKSPLQDAVQEAQTAEKRAKKHGRNALAVTLMKRSGEIVCWGCQWPSGGVALHEKLLQAGQQKVLSSRFPYKVIQLLTPYLSTSSSEERSDAKFQDAPGFNAEEVILEEVAHALKQHYQGANKRRVSFTESILKGLQQYVAASKEQESPESNRAGSILIEQVIGLCQTVAFSVRNSEKSTEAKTPNDSEDAA